MGTQRLVHGLFLPRRMTKLERDLPARRNRAEEGVEQREVLSHRRRQLEEDRPELRPEHRRAAEQLGDDGFRLLEALVVSDPPRRLEREGETTGHLLRPPREHPLARHAIEGVVDLDRRQPLGVVAEPPVGRKLLGIEAPLPLLVRVAARAGRHLHSPRPASCHARRRIYYASGVLAARPTSRRRSGAGAGRCSRGLRVNSRNRRPTRVARAPEWRGCLGPNGVYRRLAALLAKTIRRAMRFLTRQRQISFRAASALIIVSAKSALSRAGSVGAKTSLLAVQTSAAVRASKSCVSTLTSSYSNTVGGVV